MKKAMMIAASAAVLAVSPALAQQTWSGSPAPYAAAPHINAPTYTHSQARGAFAYQPGVRAGSGAGPFAYQPGAGSAAGAPVFGQAIGSTLAVSVDGIVLGQDPDPNIRASMERDADMMLGRGHS
jgi:hypothetical protein